MKITCQTCQSKYTVSDEKVQGRTVKIKCRKCGATILVNSAGAANGVADPVSMATAQGDGSTTYTVNVADGDQRTMSMAEVVAGYNSGLVNADTYVWADGMSDWLPLGQVEAIVAALNAGGAPAAEPALAPQQPAAYSPPAEQPSYGAPAAYGAAAQPAYGVGADPGYGAAAQPAYGASPSQPAPAADPFGAAPRAAVRRDPARPSADLFGGGVEPQRPSADDVATSAPLFSSNAAQGKREENSMLFSLSALTAKAATPSVSSSSKTTASREDSGIIDLKALAAGEGSGAASPVASIVPDDGGLFQLAAPIGAPATAPAIVTPVEAPQKNRGPLYIGVGIAVAGLAIAGAFFGMKGGGEPPPTATETTQASAPVVAAPPPEPEPVKTAEPEPTASAATSASAAPVVAKGPIGPRPKSTGGSTSKPATTSTGGSAPASTAPKRGNCGCAAGDLMCAMQCSAKGK